MRTRLWTAALGLVVLSWSRASVAGERCAGSINRDNLIACALAASPPLRGELASQRAAEGRREAARPFLPANPTVGGTVNSRVGPTERATNWSVTVGQQLEVAGQSWLRVEVADGELRAQEHRVSAARRDVAAQAWAAYFAVLAAQERLVLAARLEQAATAVADTVRAMAANGLASDVDADIAETAELRATSDRLARESEVAATRAQLSRSTGSAADVVVEGALEPLRLPEAGASLDAQPALLALEAQRRAAQTHVTLLQREVVPNPTVSLYAQNDGFNERVLGVGLSVPIPLPQPLGRTNAGQVAEAKALAERTDAEAERVRRELQAELTTANAQLDAALKVRRLYTPERVQRVSARLESIATQVRAARLPVRDALLAQQALVDQLKAEIDAREALCVASVRAARAAGTPLEGAAL